MFPPKLPKSIFFGVYFKEAMRVNLPLVTTSTSALGPARGTLLQSPAQRHPLSCNHSATHHGGLLTACHSHFSFFTVSKWWRKFTIFKDNNSMNINLISYAELERNLSLLKYFYTVNGSALCSMRENLQALETQSMQSDSIMFYNWVIN